jgi:simple sugar transport system substrate-binding protein
MRPRSLAVVAVPLVFCMLAACTKQGTAEKTPANAPSGPQINIAMVTHGQQFDPFWALVQKGAETAASQFNVKLAYQSPGTTNPQQQATMITQAAAAKPAAMVVTIPDPAVLGPPVKQVTAGGMPVVVANVGNGVYQSVGALTFVGQPDYQAGQAAGTALAAAGVRKALCIIFEENNTALADRCAGFTKQLAAGGGSVQTLHVNGAQLHQAQTSIEQALQKDGSINGILATGIIGFQAAGGALQARKAFGKVKFGTFDVAAAALTALDNGQLLFIIDQQPFLEGYTSVQVAAFDARFGQHPYQPIYTGPSFITKDNASKVAQLYKSTGIPLFKGGYPQ